MYKPFKILYTKCSKKTGEDLGSQGAGIYLIQNTDQIKDFTSPQLVQEYVSDPLLMSDGLKFDLRVYAVIKSINPLSIYVAREGTNKTS